MVAYFFLPCVSTARFLGQVSGALTSTDLRSTGRWWSLSVVLAWESVSRRPPTQDPGWSNTPAFSVRDRYGLNAAELVPARSVHESKAIAVAPECAVLGHFIGVDVNATSADVTVRGDGLDALGTRGAYGLVAGTAGPVERNANPCVRCVVLDLAARSGRETAAPPERDGRGVVDGCYRAR